jgi:hypothetical protein
MTMQDVRERCYSARHYIESVRGYIDLGNPEKADESARRVDDLLLKMLVDFARKNRNQMVLFVRMLANASFRLSGSNVTHDVNGRSPSGVDVCQGCGKHFRPNRPWQKRTWQHNFGTDRLPPNSLVR